eukprot:8008294-Ditylum_brightwellii.AAC.1
MLRIWQREEVWKTCRILQSDSLRAQGLVPENMWHHRYHCLIGLDNPILDIKCVQKIRREVTA